MSPEDQARICAAARSYLGVPWLGQGRSRLGLDCVGIAKVTFCDCGFEIDEGTPNYRGLDHIRLLRILARYFRTLEKNERPQPADLVIYKLPEAGHLAILVDGKHGLNAIHSPAHGKVEESRFDPKLGKIQGIHRWKEAA